MKKFICCLFAAALFACAAACAEYSPRKEDFDFGVTLSATEAECGEEIVYTVRAERVSGKKFTVRGSSTLYSVYFEPDTGEEPYFAFNDDVVTHEFDAESGGDVDFLLYPVDFRPVFVFGGLVRIFARSQKISADGVAGEINSAFRRLFPNSVG